MNADNIAELMVDLFTRLVQDEMSDHDTQTGLDPDTQDLLAMHFLKETKDAIARLEREMLATTSLDYTTLGAALGISKQAARNKVATAKQAQAEHESRVTSPQTLYAPITLEWAVKHLPPVAHRVRGALRNPHLAGAVDPNGTLPERTLTSRITVVSVGRGGKRLNIIEPTEQPS